MSVGGFLEYLTLKLEKSTENIFNILTYIFYNRNYLEDSCEYFFPIDFEIRGLPSCISEILLYELEIVGEESWILV